MRGDISTLEDYGPYATYTLTKQYHQHPMKLFLVVLLPPAWAH